MYPNNENSVAASLKTMLPFPLESNIPKPHENERGGALAYKEIDLLLGFLKNTFKANQHIE